MEKLLSIFMVIIIILAFSFIMAIPTTLLWNWLMPTIFGLSKINFLQAIGINILSGILFNRPTTIKK